MDRKQMIIGIVLAALLSAGLGYMAGKQGTGQAQETLAKIQAENVLLKKQAADAAQKVEAVQAELAAFKKQAQLTPKLEPYMLASIQRAGIADPERLIEDLKQHPAVIPSEAVLGGTMHFTQVGLINERWVYGAFEDGHIAGAAVFEWQLQNGEIIWTPILVTEE